jgi:hypoxanthine phosphoribosyltransferase
MVELNLQLLYSKDFIARQVQRLGQEINRDYQGTDVLLVAVLKGSFLFVADLAREISSPISIDFVHLTSYGAKTCSSGIVEFRKDLETPIQGRDVIIVEDIIDSGLTLETLYQQLLLRQPKSLKICTLIDKHARRQSPVLADYIGITMDDGFIVGYGLDLDEKYRNLPEIYLVQGF